MHPSTSLLDLIIKNKTDSKKIIGKMYTVFNDHKLTTLEGLKHRWEGELGETIPETTWLQVSMNISNSSGDLLYILRLYIISTDLDPTCGLGKTAPATLLHMFYMFHTSYMDGAQPLRLTPT